MITVELRKLRLFGFHGLYPEEKKNGCEFEIDVAVSYQPNEESITEINSTINYVKLFELVKEEFNTPVNLLENLALNFAHKIKSQFPQIRHIRITVQKLNPPITGFSGNVAVTFEKNY